ncbi:MAG: nucleoside-diphosphate sugar epimerase [Thermoproteota archaeon]|nr:MAG: nucleoside-diphosphate sugar epimerase [Candidatus Korarchaeota archaeon]
MLVFGSVLVSGGAGFIGSHIVELLLSRNEVERVLVLDNFFTGKLDNLKPFLKDQRLKIVRGDIRNRDLVKKLIKEVDFVFHQAAIVSVPLSIKEPELTNDVNVNGTINLLEAALDSDIERFVYASSCAIYGNPDSLPIREESRIDPLSPYAASKLAAESYCRAFYQSYGLKTVCLRYFNVYGPRQAGGAYSGVISIVMRQILEGKSLTIRGDGSQTRDFVFVKDVAEANLLASERDEAVGKVFNIGTGKAITIKELAEIISSITGRNTGIKYVPMLKGEVLHSVADITLARRVLGYNPKFTLEEGLRRTFKWLAADEE